MDLRLEPVSGRFDPLDDQWLIQVGEFVVELNHEVGGVERLSQPVPGTKGSAGHILLSLGSAGVLTASVEFFKAWLGRDQTRSLKVTWTADGGLQTVELSGTDLSKDVVDGVQQALAKGLAGSG
jgi:hypothetical protein